MPFISSIRGSFGAQSKSRRNGSKFMITGGTTEIAGGYRIHTFTNIGNNTFNSSDFGFSLSAECFMWGAGGAAAYDGGWGYWGAGGAGGYAGGNITFSPSKNYIVKVGDGGYDRYGGTLNEGGGMGGTPWGNGGGGGLSGIFDTSYSFSNALLISGGGGGGGSSRAGGNGTSAVNRGGGGGGSTGGDGSSASSNRRGRGGSQSGITNPDAGDYNSSGWIQAGQLTGGYPQPHGGGGGGGYYGGSGGAFFEPNDMGGAGGGSGYAAGSVSNATLTQASFASEANTGSQYYNSSYGRAGQSSRGERGSQGRVIIRYLI
jgi:hypothetical protein